MSTAPRLGACLFDLDGTLIDSIDLIMESFRHTMRTHLGSVPDEARWRNGFGTPLRTQLRAFARDDDEAERMVATYRSYTHAHHDRLLRSYAGIDRGLAVLSGAGIRLAVVTSKTHALARRGLARCGLNHYFDVLVGFDDVDEHKPHPAPVLAALDLLGVDAGDTLFVGDSPHDIRAGRAAGVRTAAVLWGPFPREALARESPHRWLAGPDRIADLARPCGHVGSLR